MNEAALLVAVAAPLATIVALNLALLLAGEEDTLLLPGLRAYPPVGLDAPRAQAAAAPEPHPEGEDDFRLAA